MKLLLTQNIIYKVIMLWLVKYRSETTEYLPEIGEKGSLDLIIFQQELYNFEPVSNEP